MKQSVQKEVDTRLDAMTAGLWLLVALAFVCLFGFMGNTHEPARYGPSIVSWMINQWEDPGSNSSHGWFIPAVSLYLVWRKRSQLASCAKRTDFRALVVIVASLILYWAGYRAQQPRMGILCLLGLLWSVPWLIWGAHVARLLFFPVVYLLFCMPMGFLTPITFPLRLVSSSVTETLLNGFGIDTVRAGTAIFSAQPDGFRLDVADACSGLQSIVALTALTAAYAHLAHEGIVKRWLLFLSAFPIAMAGNTFRVLTIAIVAETIGLDVAMKVYHDFSGFLVFGAAVILMVAFSAVLNVDWKERWARADT